MSEGTERASASLHDRVEELERLVELMRTEVRTRSLVVVDEHDRPRITASVTDGEHSASLVSVLSAGGRDRIELLAEQDGGGVSPSLGLFLDDELVMHHSAASFPAGDGMHHSVVMSHGPICDDQVVVGHVEWLEGTRRLVRVRP
jgi:hypothetical protein